MTTPRSNWLADAISGDALRRFPQSILGQAIFAVGLALMVNGGIGLPSWEILHQGLGYRLGITIGQAAQLSGLFVILLWIPIRQAPGLGTLSNIVVIGFVMDLTIEALRLLGVPAKEVLSQDLPAAIAATDGRWVIAGLDRNGLRPLRFTLTDDDLTTSSGGFLSESSEVVDVSPFYPIYYGPCALCSVNHGSDQRYYVNNYVVNARAQRYGNMGATPTIYRLR